MTEAGITKEGADPVGLGFPHGTGMTPGTVASEHPREAGEIIIDDCYDLKQVWNVKPLQK